MQPRWYTNLDQTRLDCPRNSKPAFCRTRLHRVRRLRSQSALPRRRSFFKKSPRRVRFWKMFAIEKLPKVLEHFSVIFPMSLRACRIVHTVFALAPWVNRLKNALETGFYSKPTP